MNEERERGKIEKEEERRRKKEEKARLKAEKQAQREEKRRERREGVPLYLAMPEEPYEPPLEPEPVPTPEAEKAAAEKPSRKEERERRKREKQEKKKQRKEEKARAKAEKQALKEARKRERGKAGPPEEVLEEAPAQPVPREVAMEEMTIPTVDTGMDEEALPEAVVVEAVPEMVAEAEAPEVPPFEEIPPEEEKKRWITRLRKGLSKSRLNFVAPLSKAFATRRFDDYFWEEVEDILVGADVGVDMTMTLVERTRERMAEEKVKEPEELLALFREVLAESIDIGDRQLVFTESGPSVFMIVGVNGTGKTTTIAKLGHLLRQDDKTVILAAGDTFRAAGIEQLEEWGNRVGLHTVKHKQGADSAAVIHDAVESALARDMDVVIADTAGRLHTKTNLMEELKKIKRVAEREARVTETLLVIDATTGQNGLIQAREFKNAVDVTGVVLTKLDGTAKGGIVVAIGHDLGIPIKFIGVGEGVEDLHPFDPGEFAEALFS